MMDATKYLIVLFFVWSGSLNAQMWSDNFNDTDLSANPTWFGQTENFITLPNGQLRLSAPEGGTTSIYAPVDFADSTSWQGFALLDFSPSNANQLRVYLQTDGPSLTASNGYYLRVGADGSTDAVQLYRQTGASSTLLASCTAGAVANQPAQFFWRVTRSVTGEWRIETDYNIGAGWQLEATAVDNTYPASVGTYFGIHCIYTITRKDHFYFDDFEIDGYSEPDTTPPTVFDVAAQSAQELKVTFSEAVEQAGVQVNQFKINGQNAASAVFQDAKTVLLTAATPFTTGANTWSVENIADLAGNLLVSDNGQFFYALVGTVKPNDLVITEIMADPTPVVGLPDTEWFEIYNRADYAINLSNVSMSAGSTTQQLPDFLLLPGQYTIVCDDSAVASFGFTPTQQAQVAFVGSMPALVNSNDTIIIYDANNVQIAAQHYNLTFYQDVLKSNGGWTLERTTTDAPCNLSAILWRASADPTGGTPMAPNSISLPDTTIFRPIRLDKVDNQTLLLEFNQIVPPETLNPDYFNVLPNTTEIDLVAYANTLQTHVLLTLLAPFDTDSLTLVLNNIANCANQTLAANFIINTWDLDIPPIAPYSVLINEIMADPTPVIGLPESEFIELFNTTNAPVKLEGCVLKSGTTLSEALPASVVLPPNGYLVIHKENIDFSNFGSSLYWPSMPALSNEGDDIALIDAQNNQIDIVWYTTGTYNDSKKAEGGWTLERINPLNPCAVTSHFTASAQPTGGTPGQTNSVLQPQADNNGPVLSGAFLESPTLIRLFFNEALSQNLPVQSVTLVPNVEVASVYTGGAYGQDLYVVLQTPLEPAVFYTVEVATLLSDCQGNASIGLQSWPIAIPDIPEPGDVVVNEFMYEPQVGGSRYIELLNRSNRIISLKGAVLGAIRPTGTDVQPIDLPVLLFPDSLVVLATVPEDIPTRYTVPRPYALFRQTLPSWDSKTDNITLYAIENGEAILLDSFTYNQSWHNSLLSSRRGVALERLGADLPSRTSFTWQSAAATAGFGTPTGPNSQRNSTDFSRETLISLGDKILSPDGDGYRDQLFISITPNKPGGVMSITIFDSEGVQVIELVNRASLGDTNVWQWDGQTALNRKARIGHYIIVADVVYPDGSRQQGRAVCALGGL